MPAPAENAVAIFGRSFNCSQSVFSAFSAQFGLSEQTALKLASPFGGGVARHGEICGAVTGALLVLGLARGADTPAGKEAIYQLAQEYMRRFEAKHGSCLCRTLIGSDISTPEGWQKARQAGKFTETCPGLVRDAAEIVQALLETTTPIPP
jgi:C_GCAxxG_C_C family probable redox protein